jgi:hypothetical protein
MVTGKKYWRGGGCFCRGFCEKWGAERGFLMVKTWWMCGETWWENALRLGAKNMPRLSNLFLQPKVRCVRTTRLLLAKEISV